MTFHAMSTTPSVPLLNQNIEKGPLTIFNTLHSDPDQCVANTDWNMNSWPVTPNTAVLHSAPSWNLSGMTVFAKRIQSWGKLLFIAVATLVVSGGVVHLRRGCEAVEISINTISHHEGAL